METGNAVLAKARPPDKTWEIERYSKDPQEKQSEKWAGENLLGKALMKVREVLKETKQI